VARALETRTIAAVTLWVTTAALNGCGSSRGDGEPGAAAGHQALVVSPGVTVSSATYTISGPNDFASAGTVPVGDSPDLSIVLNGIPVATGYQIDVSATASDGVTTCEASTQFDVTGPSTTVQVHLVCGVPTGDVQVTGSLNVCPVLDGVDVLPNAPFLGGTAALTASAHDADNGPNPLVYSWSAGGASLGNHPQPTLTFTCTAAGPVVIKVTVSDGDPNPACADSLTATVTCTAP